MNKIVGKLWADKSGKNIVQNEKSAHLENNQFEGEKEFFANIYT